MMPVPQGRRLERAAGRNVECMWLTGKLAPGFKTIWGGGGSRVTRGAADDAARRAASADARAGRHGRGGDGLTRPADLADRPGCARNGIAGGRHGTGRHNLQAAVDADTHIVVAHEVINLGHDRTSLASMEEQPREATRTATLTVLADRCYFSRPQVLACEEAGLVPICPKPLTSRAKADGRFGKQDFTYQPEIDTYRCPAGETLTRCFAPVDQSAS